MPKKTQQTPRLRRQLTSKGTMLGQRERQFILHHLKKGPAVDRAMLTGFLGHLTKDCLAIDIHALAEAKMQRWRDAGGQTYAKPAANETFLY